MVLSAEGIETQRHCHRWRQVLFVPQATLDEFSVSATVLRANVVMHGGTNIHSLPSGTIITIGAAKVRLTYHCEPCKKIKDFVSTKAILHKRGYFGQIITAGALALGDRVDVTAERLEAIPYPIGDRVRWYLDQITGPISATQLVSELGLSSSYCRTLPSIIRNRPDIDRSRITYLSATKKRQK
jgi:MOSC domain-containing protein YiiM